MAATFAVALHREPRSIGETIPASISPEAREAYLKGRYYWNRRTVPDLDRAVDFFRDATEREPRFALAWAGLADAYNFVAQAPRAKVAARRAMEIDPHCAPAHAALGNASLFHDYDWAAAERSFDSALENDPTYATALHWRAFLYLTERRYAEARRDIERARRLDPLSKIITTDVGAIEYYSREYERAMAHYRHALDLDPTFAQARLMMAWTYFRMGYLHEAQSMLAKESDLLLDVQLMAARGEIDRARAILGQLEQEENLRARRFTKYQFACAYAAAGDQDRALRWLARAYEAHEGELVLVHIDPSLDPLRATPAFAEFVRTHNLALR